MTVPASVFTQTRSWKAVRTEQHTFLARPGREAESADMLYYDLKADPYQMKPQREERNNRALFQSLKGQLHTWLERTRDPFARFVQ